MRDCGRDMGRAGARAAAAAALARAERAARKVALAVDASRAGAGRGGSCTAAAKLLLADDPQRDGRDRVASFLRASRELQSAGGMLVERSSHLQHLATVDRRIARTEELRGAIAAALREHGGGPADEGGARCQAFGGAAAEGGARPEAADIALGVLPPVPEEVLAAGGELVAATELEVASMEGRYLRDFVDEALFCPPEQAGGLPIEASSASVPPRVVKPRVLELRSVPCPEALLGVDCAFCLVAFSATDLVLAFPCPAGHTFHSGCLQRWLRVAGSKATCPMCRSQPGARGPRRRAAASGPEAAAAAAARTGGLGPVAPRAGPPLARALRRL